MTDSLLSRRHSAIRQPAHRAPQRHGRHHSHSCLPQPRCARLFLTPLWDGSSKNAGRNCCARCAIRGRDGALRSAHWSTACIPSTRRNGVTRRSRFNTWLQMASGLSELRGIRYGAAIDFQGAIRSALLARWSGAHVVYGSAQPRENAASMFYTRKVLLNTNGTHVVEQARGNWLKQSLQLRPFCRKALQSRRSKLLWSFQWTRMRRTELLVLRRMGTASRFSIPARAGERRGGRPERLWTGCEGACKRWIMFARKLRAGRRTSGAGRGNRQRRDGAKKSPARFLS